MKKIIVSFNYRLAVLSLFLVISSLITSNSYAYDYNGIHWNGAKANFNFGTTLPQSFYSAVYNGAIKTWNNGSPSKFQFILNYSSSNKVGYVYIDGRNGILAQAFYPWRWENGHKHIYAAKIHLDNAESWNTNTYSTPSSSQADAWSVAAHEFGHWLSLGHSTSSPDGYKPTMYPSIPYGQYFPRSLAYDDRNGIYNIYDK